MNTLRLPVRVHRALPGLLVASAAIAGCVGDPQVEPVDVVATLYPLSFLAQQIAPNLTVAQLVGAGQEAHSWEPSFSDIQRVASARILVAQGAGMEPWLGDLLDALGEDAPVVLRATDGLTLLPLGEYGHEHEDEREGSAEREGGPGDPHTWLDPLMLIDEARIVERALAGAFPEHAHDMVDPAQELVDDLELLDEAYAGALHACDARVVIVNHNAYSYLGARYNFTVEAVHGLSPDAEPSPRVVQRLEDLAREHDIHIVFFEELASPRTVQAIARDVGADTRVLHNIENPDPEQLKRGVDYFSLQRENIGNLHEAMRCL